MNEDDQGKIQQRLYKALCGNDVGRVVGVFVNELYRTDLV